MFALIVLAVIATGLMLWQNSEAWLKAAVIASLWAAFLGAVLSTKFLSALRGEVDRSEQMASMYIAELDKEQSMSAARTAQLEAQFQAQSMQTRDQLLEELRGELAEMRRQLSEFPGFAMPTDEQLAMLHAERMKELERSSGYSDQGSHGGVEAGYGSYSEYDDYSEYGDLESTVPQQHNPPTRPSAEAVRASRTGSQLRYGGQNSQAADTGRAEQPASYGAASYEDQSQKPSFSTGSFAAVNWGGDDTHPDSEVPLIVDTSTLDAPDTAAADNTGGHYATDGYDSYDGYGNHNNGGYDQGYQQSYDQGYGDSYGSGQGDSYSENYSDSYGDTYGDSYGQGYSETQFGYGDGSYGDSSDGSYSSYGSSSYADSSYSEPEYTSANSYDGYAGQTAQPEYSQADYNQADYNQQGAAGAVSRAQRRQAEEETRRAGRPAPSRHGADQHGPGGEPGVTVADLMRRFQG